MRAAAVSVLVTVAAALAGADAPEPEPAPAPPATTAAPAAAPGPHWDYLPTVGYPGDSLRFALRVGDAARWSVRNQDGELGAERLEGAAVIAASVVVPAREPRGEEWVELADASERLRVRLVRPGGGSGLAWQPGRRLRLAEDPAVLVVDRTEAQQDRRWRAFRALGGVEPVRCGVLLEAPTVPAGEPAALALAAASQALAVRGESVLVLLPGADRDAGWKHREYRQAVAWVVSDLLRRGAAHVVLAGPIAPAVESDALEPLRRQVADVAQAYRCRTVPLEGLGDAALWELAPGVLGPGLNARGKEALAEALQEWR